MPAGRRRRTVPDRPPDRQHAHLRARRAAARRCRSACAGELYIGGVRLARGYLQPAGLTAERFVADPFATGPGARLYRTGDLARWLAGRQPRVSSAALDHQVKIRGFRIELGEIEAALAAHPACARRWSWRARTGGDRRAGRLRRVGARTAPPAELRAFLRAALPDYMVPGRVVVLDALPLTPNGKVDRRALPAPELRGAAADASVAAAHAGRGGARRRSGPRCSASTRSASDDELLRAGRPLAARHPGHRRGCARRSGSSCRCAPIFEAPTVAELAARVEAARAAVTTVPHPAAAAARATGAAPLSFAQAAPVVPRAAGAGQRRLQHAAGAQSPRPARRGGAGGEPYRDRASGTRRCGRRSRRETASPSCARRRPRRGR